MPTFRLPTRPRGPARASRTVLLRPVAAALAAGALLAAAPQAVAAPTTGVAPAATPVAGAPAALPAAPATTSDKGPTGWDQYRHLDRVDELTTGVETRQFSSFDRTGGNDHDGFDGRYSCLRTESDGCVIAERSGAGEVESVWFTRDNGDVTRTGNIRIVLDGTTVLDAKLQDVVDGTLGAPFVHPFVANADQSSGGVQIKVPMPYRSSMKIVTDENPLFYHVTYRTFADAVGVRTFDPKDPARDVIRASRTWGSADPKPTTPGRTDTRTRAVDLAPGASTTLATAHGPGALRSLRLRLPQLVGPKVLPTITDDGRATRTSTRFTVKVDPDNQGVTLRRRWDAASARQVADVFVDGTKVARWPATDDTPGHWSYQTITLPASVTHGKSSITVKNVFVSAGIDWNEFHYWVDSLMPSGGDTTPKRTDELDVGTSPDARASEDAHDYVIVGQTWTGTASQTDAPTDTDDPAILASNDVLRDLMVRVSADGKVRAESPLGEFFGTGLNVTPVSSLFFSVDPKGWWTSWWPMPYGHDLTVSLVNRSAHAVSGGSAQVTTARDTRMAKALQDGRVGYFNATHHRGDTTPGEDWTFLDTTGRGRFVGVAQTMRGHIETGNLRAYLEGDERVHVDGSRSPQIHGTGTEDFYEAGWYFNRGRFSQPFNGDTAMPLHQYGCAQQCDSPYRLMIGDAVPFDDHLRFDIEHGPVSDAPAEYSSTAFWFGGAVPSARVSDTVDLGDARSRAAHAYTGPTDATARTTTFEGRDDALPVTDQVVASGAPQTFRLALDRHARGVTLRRLSDQKEGYQRATVTVDGRSAGTWLEPLENTTSSWLEDDFAVDPALTRGKRSVRVTVTPATGDGVPDWTAAQYQAISLGLKPRPDRRAPSAVTGLVAGGTDQNEIRLRWDSSTDDVAVDHYEVYGSTDPGFRPSPDTLLGTPGVASFDHVGIGLHETWYYRVRAVDTSGNTGALSGSASARSGSTVAIEGESLVPPKSATAPVDVQGNCCGVSWSGGAQLWFHAAKAGDTATLTFSVPTTATYDLTAVETTAPDYGIVQLAVDGKDVGDASDDYRANGVGTVDVDLGSLRLAAGQHTLTMSVTGKNAASAGYLAGLDVLRLQASDLGSAARVTAYRTTDRVVQAGDRQRIFDPSVGEDGPWYVNDHTFVKGPDGLWHLFGITHAEPAAPLDESYFVHATAKTLTQKQWDEQDPVIRADASLGEKHVWAPYVMKRGDTYYMFYAAGTDTTHADHQLRLATSKDLYHWTKRTEPLFTDGFDARDPMVMRVGDRWVMYYTANSTPTGGHHEVAYRTSRDLVHWGEKEVAFTHPDSGTFGGPTESPFVVHSGTWYYLFVCCDGGYRNTRVYRSHDPLHFEYSRLDGKIDEHAAEVVRGDDGRWYVSGAGWGQGGVYLRPLDLTADVVHEGRRITASGYRMTLETAPTTSITGMEIPDGRGGWHPVLDGTPRGTAPYLGVGAFGVTDPAGAAADVAVDGDRITVSGFPFGDEPATGTWRLDLHDATFVSDVEVDVASELSAGTFEATMFVDGTGSRTGDDVDPDRPVGDVSGLPRWTQSSGDASTLAAALRPGSAFRDDNHWFSGGGGAAWQPWWAPGGRALRVGEHDLGALRIGAVPWGGDDSLGADLRRGL